MKNIIKCTDCAFCGTFVTAEEGTLPRCSRNSGLFESIMWELRLHHAVSANWLSTSEEHETISRETVFETEFSEWNDYHNIENTFEAQLLQDISGHIVDEDEILIEDDCAAAGFDYIESLGAVKFQDPECRWVRTSTIINSIALRIAHTCPMYEDRRLTESPDAVLHTPAGDESIEMSNFDKYIDTLAMTAGASCF